MVWGFSINGAAFGGLIGGGIRAIPAGPAEGVGTAGAGSALAVLISTAAGCGRVVSWSSANAAARTIFQYVPPKPAARIITTTYESHESNRLAVAIRTPL